MRVEPYNETKEALVSSTKAHYIFDNEQYLVARICVSIHA